MAKILSQTGIDTSQTVEAWHVTQSIDAFTGVEAYDITISGSLTLQNGTQGSDKIAVSDGNGNINFTSGITASLQGTASYAITASYSLNGGTPAGSDTQIQYNNGGIFGASSDFRFNDNVNSLMHGSNLTASGFGSFARGFGSTSFGNYSHAEGYQTRASGSYSHAEGYFTTASGYISHAEGRETISSGDYSHAEGRETISSGIFSHAEGVESISPGTGSHAEGYQTTSSGNYSHAEGVSTVSFGIYSHAEGSTTIASGSYSHAEGFSTLTLNLAAHAEGVYTTASGQSAHAEGLGSHAQGLYSHAEGGYTVGPTIYRGGNSFGQGSHAEGALTLSSGVGSHAEGSSTTSSGQFSHSEGWLTNAYGAFQTVVGIYNTVGVLNSTTNPFIVGDGDPLFTLTRSNAFRVASGGNCYAGATFINGGADYAEYFESYDGTSIPVGTIVELTGSFIKPCEIAENAIGVISTRPTLLGNSDDGTADTWVGKYEKDKWGNFITEDNQMELPTGETITIPSKKISPDFDPNKSYTPRAERPEWNVVGLLGQIKILKNQPIPSRWIKMKDIDDEIALYLVR
jgi:hypothetical protein